MSELQAVESRVRRALVAFASAPLPGRPHHTRARPLPLVSIVEEETSHASATRTGCLRSERSVAARRRVARAVLLLHRKGITVTGGSFSRALVRTIDTTLKAHGAGVSGAAVEFMLRRNPDFARRVLRGQRRAKDSQDSETGKPPS